MNTDLSCINSLKQSLDAGTPLPEALTIALGNTEAAGGLWRFFSSDWPGAGVEHWNSTSEWKRHWQPFLPGQVFAFGEDVFGNQLLAEPGVETVQLWNHENGECSDLFADPVTLISVVCSKGIEWIDFYSDGSLDVARRRLPLARSHHLHWTTPLVLGGRPIDANVSLVEREPHLVGHAKLWRQIGGLPPGTRVI